MTDTELVYIAPRNCSTRGSLVYLRSLITINGVVLCAYLLRKWRENEWKALGSGFLQKMLGGGEVVEPLLPRSDLFKIDKLSTLEWQTHIQQNMFILFIPFFKFHLIKHCKCALYSLLFIMLILDYKPELGTFKWDILNPDRLINLGINNKIKKGVDYTLIPISTFQKFPALFNI